jgi:hypothetical protein
VDFIERYYGMALVNTHPDYLQDELTWRVYHAFLTEMKNRRGYWHALPGDIAKWWKARSSVSGAAYDPFPVAVAAIGAESNHLEIRLGSGAVSIQP